MCQLPELLQRGVEVPVDVVCQGLERGDIHTVDPVLKFPGLLEEVEFIDDGQESCHGLSAAGG